MEIKDLQTNVDSSEHLFQTHSLIQPQGNRDSCRPVRLGWRPKRPKHCLTGDPPLYRSVRLRPRPSSNQDGPPFVVHSKDGPKKGHAKWKFTRRVCLLSTTILACSYGRTGPQSFPSTDRTSYKWTWCNVLLDDSRPGNPCVVTYSGRDGSTPMVRSLLAMVSTFSQYTGFTVLLVVSFLSPTPPRRDTPVQSLSETVPL